MTVAHRCGTGTYGRPCIHTESRARWRESGQAEGGGNEGKEEKADAQTVCTETQMVRQTQKQQETDREQGTSGDRAKDGERERERERETKRLVGWKCWNETLIATKTTCRNFVYHMSLKNCQCHFKVCLWYYGSITDMGPEYWYFCRGPYNMQREIPLAHGALSPRSARAGHPRSRVNQRPWRTLL